MKTNLKTKTIIILAAVITALVFIVTILTSEMSYMISDDTNIQSTLSGGLTGGVPYPIQQFINVVISYPIAGLYKLFPMIQWWYVFCLILVIIGIFLVNYCFFKIGIKNNFPFPFIIAVVIFFDIGFFVYPIANITFTIVPAILGTGIVASLFWLSEADLVKHEKWILVGTIIGYILVLCVRRQTGIALLCYILLAYSYYYISRYKDKVEIVIRLAVTVGIFLLITVSLTEINNAVQKQINGAEFSAFSSARSQFLDYPHVTYNEDPELYEEIEWNEDTYNLANSWCFIDDDVNTETLSYIDMHSEYTTEDMMKLLKDIYHDNLCWSIVLLFAISFIMAGFVSIISCEKKAIFFWGLNNILTFAFFCYQIIGGRAIYRSLIVFLLPGAAINVMLSFRKEMRKKVVGYIYIFGVLILGVVCVRPMLTATFNKEHNLSVASTKERFIQFCEYTTEHNDNFYIVQQTSGAVNNIDPKDPGLDVSNWIGWGKSFYYSALYYKQLEENGLTELTGDTFKKENVYFVSPTNVLSESYYDNGSDGFAAYSRYLEENYGALGFVLEDTIPCGEYVYHFVFEENASVYECYYNIRDGYTVQILP